MLRSGNLTSVSGGMQCNAVPSCNRDALPSCRASYRNSGGSARHSFSSRCPPTSQLSIIICVRHLTAAAVPPRKPTPTWLGHVTTMGNESRNSINIGMCNSGANCFPHLQAFNVLGTIPIRVTVMKVCTQSITILDYTYVD